MSLQFTSQKYHVPFHWNTPWTIKRCYSSIIIHILHFYFEFINSAKSLFELRLMFRCTSVLIQFIFVYFMQEMVNSYPICPLKGCLFLKLHFKSIWLNASLQFAFSDLHSFHINAEGRSFGQLLMMLNGR